MTMSTTISPRPVPLDRPDWLTRDVWPFPTAAIEVDGHRVAYTDTGGDQPALLFCHVGMWSLMWRDVMIELSTDYRCVAFDTPGVGLSSRIAGTDQTLTTAARATGALIDALDLRNVVLVIHDLGGLAALAAANDRLDRINSVAVISGFAWRPRGVMLPVALRIFGSAPMRELGAFTGWLPRGSSTRFGVGRHMSKATRRAWRAGLADRSARRVTHRLFADAARNREVQRDAEAAITALDDRALLTIFGQLGDYFRFQRQWHQRRPDLTQWTIRRGFHFPMCDNPAQVASDLRRWLHSSE
jgi:pimeloyl-ACP methyl ester carboxylesterase